MAISAYKMIDAQLQILLQKWKMKFLRKCGENYISFTDFILAILWNFALWSNLPCLSDWPRRICSEDIFSMCVHYVNLYLIKIQFQNRQKSRWLLQPRIHKVFTTGVHLKKGPSTFKVQKKRLSQSLKIQRFWRIFEIWAFRPVLQRGFLFTLKGQRILTND